MKKIEIIRAMVFAKTDEEFNEDDFILLDKGFLIENIFFNKGMQEAYTKEIPHDANEIAFIWNPVELNEQGSPVPSTIQDSFRTIEEAVNEIPKIEDLVEKLEDYIEKVQEEYDDDNEVEVVNTINLKSRIATTEEINLIKDFWFDKGKSKKVEINETVLTNDLDNSINIVFDVTEDFKIFVSSSTEILFYKDGTKSVENCEYKYAIKHGLVYMYDETDEFGAISDDVEEDISDIQSILNK